MSSERAAGQPPTPVALSDNQAEFPHSGKDEADLAQVWSLLYARRFLITGISVLLAVVAALGSYLLKPVFRAEVLVVPVTEQRNQLGGLAAQFGGLAELAGVRLGGAGNKAAAVATLKSRSLTEAFIRDRALMPVLFEESWDSENNRWEEVDPKKVPTLWDAYRLFDRDVRKLQEDRRTGLVTLSIEWHDPDAAADWANELVRRANAKLQRDTISEGEKTIAYLEQQLAKAGVLEVRQALYSLIEMETKQIAVAHAREEFAFTVIDPAVAPRKKVKPNRALILLGGFFVGLVASVVWVVFRGGNA